MNTDHSSEDALYDAARRLTAPEARAAFLDAACTGNPALRERLEELLQAAAEADDFFGRNAVDLNRLPPLSASDPTLIAPANENAGDRIGRYKLLQQIGEGGFGTVWMAEQVEPVTRRVALKIIKLGMDTKEVIARFEAERQALAMMDHPNIAKVLDAGATQFGRPFFVMELVKGMPITDYCDEAALGTRERLALFGDVCSAINHAHQKGIIHRDIKPSNVMVTLHGDKPVVKVIDFGIAKATQGKLTDQTLFTRFEQFIGTPVYMSPEQAAMSGLDIDTRSDIYALGILLYQLLVGKPPFDAKSLVSAGYEEMRRIIREVEPVKPSSRLGTIVGEERTLLAKSHRIEEGKLNKLVEPDLDWIVMKAIEKDRTRRYETANAFAQDIVRFLADEPVTATPPSAGYQFRKFARRHKAAFRLAAGIALLLVAATLVSGWQAVRATKAEALAKDHLVESEKARADAEAISNFLTGMFESSRRGEEKGGRDVKVADVLDIAAKKLDTELADQPERRAKLQAALGSTYHSLGLLPQAIILHEQARGYYLKTLGPEHPDTLGALRRLAWSCHVAGRRDEALRMLEDVLRLSRKVSGPEHPFTLATMGLLAHSYGVAGRKDEALNLRGEVLALRRKVLGPEHPDTLKAMGDLARSYGSAGRKEDALKLGEEALALSRKVLGPEHPDTIGAMGASAASYADNDRKNEALKLREEALALHRKVSGPEHPFTLGAMRFLGHSYGVAGRKDEAHNLRGEVLALSRKVLGPEHPDTLQAMGDLARSYGSAGRKEDALKLREEALALSRKVLGPEHPDTIAAMEELAKDYGSTGHKDDSLKVFTELLEVRRKVNGPDHPDTFAVMGDVARCYIELGREEEGFELGDEIIAICRDKEIAAGPGIAWSFNLLGIQYHNARRLDGAITLRETVAAMARKIDGPASGFAFDMMNNLAESYDAAGRRDEAAKLRAEIKALKAKK